MSTQRLAAAIPIAIENPEDWPQIASDIEKHSGKPPSVDLAAIEHFLGGCIPLLFEADKTHNAEILRGSFADQLIGKLLRLSVPMGGWTAVAADVILIGAPAAEQAILRLRANVQARGLNGDPSLHEQFWDLALGDLTATVSTTSCPRCGAPLAQGELVCGYCHADTRATVHVPLQVVRLERIS